MKSLIELTNISFKFKDIKILNNINLKISDLFFEESLIKVTGKGNKERFVPISTHAQNYIKDYQSKKRSFF